MNDNKFYISQSLALVTVNQAGKAYMYLQVLSFEFKVQYVA